jgi:tetratricopeptide (TPR) repeat protein
MLYANKPELNLPMYSLSKLTSIILVLVLSAPLLGQSNEDFPKVQDLDSLLDIPEDQRTPDTYFRLAYVYDDLSKLDSGLFYISKAAALVQNKVEEAKIKRIYGYIAYRLGLFSMAQKAAFESLELSIAQSDTTMIKRNYWLLALIADGTGLHDKSILYYRKGLEMDPNDVDFLVDLGAVFYKNKDYYNAVGYNQDLLKRPLDSLSIAIVHNNLGDAFLKLREYDSAFKHIQATLNITTAMKDSASVMYDTYLLGKYYFGVNDMPKARQCFNKSLELDAKFGAVELFWTDQELPVLYDMLSQVYRKENKMDSAIMIKDKLIALTQKFLAQQQKTTSQIIFSGEEAQIQELLIQQQKSRRSLLEYYAMGLGLIMILIGYFILNGFEFSQKARPYLSVVLLIFTFEFLLILLDPFLSNWTMNEPIISFMVNVAIALALVPVQLQGERFFKKYAVRVSVKNMSTSGPDNAN